MAAFTAIRKFRDRPLETTRAWVGTTLIMASLALLVHLTAQTYFFTSNYFEPPNLYDVWPRIDQVTHALSAMALTATLCNFNLPYSLRRKWIVGLGLSFILGLLWEGAEYLTAPQWGWIRIATADTLLDLWQDFLGSSFAVLLYSHLVRRPSRVWRLGWEALGLNVNVTCGGK
ncbi:MAG: hypothetical protein QW238_07620 [Candidatus Bathyarchaeia archaeon]